MSRAPGEWPYGSGEMARLIRSHNWAKTPLGPIEAWPQSLRTAVDLILASPVANILVCGPDRVIIYNDPCIILYRGKHPHALGLRGPEAFPELWGEIGPLYDRVFAGEALSFDAQPWAFERGAASGNGLYDAWFTPLNDERGEVVCAYVTAVEVTDRAHAQAALRESEERQSFLLELGDRIRNLVNPEQIMAAVAGAIGRHMGVGRCGYGEVDETGEFFTVERDWTDGRMESLAGTVRLNDFGGEIVEHYESGRTVVIEDPLADPRTAGSEAAYAEAGRMRAGIGVPLVKAGRFVAAFYVHQTTPRHWTGEEEALLADVAERTWAAVERARAEAALRESETRYRVLFESIDEGFCIVEVLFDPNDKPLDYRFLQINPAFHRQTGLVDAVGKTMREMAPQHEQHWFDIYGRIALTGEPARFEDKAAALGRWYEVYAFRIGEPEQRQVAILFRDVIERKRAEAALRDSQERIRQFGDASSDVLWIRNARTLQWEYLTPAFETIYGISREEALKGDNYTGWSDLILPEDRDNALAQIERVRQGESVTFEYRVRRPSDGAIRWLRNTDFPLRDASGRVQSIGGIGEDITTAKATGDRMELMIAELQHRTRNLIGVVRSIASQTLSTSPSLDHFRAEFEGRMAALAAVQGLLARSDVAPIMIGALIELELSALGAAASEDRMTVEGPPVRLRNSIVQTLALAIHELATNARKHGALATPNGHLSVRWHTAERDSRQHLVIDWYESGIEAQSPNPTGGGYGRKLIEQALPYSVGGKTDFELTATELRCRIELPLK